MTDDGRTRDALLPCPFCGGEAEVFTDLQGWRIRCSACTLVEFPSQPIQSFTSKANAVEFWNRRAGWKREGELWPEKTFWAILDDFEAAESRGVKEKRDAFVAGADFGDRNRVGNHDMAKAEAALRFPDPPDTKETRPSTIDELRPWLWHKDECAKITAMQETNISARRSHLHYTLDDNQPCTCGLSEKLGKKK